MLTLNNLQEASNTGSYVFVATDPNGLQWPAPHVSLTVEGFPPYAVAVTNIFDSSEQGGFPATNAVDGDLSTYWVSYGTVAGQQPTAASPEWLFVQFARPISLAEFLVYPRNGYGPNACQMLVNCGLVPGIPTNGFETFGIPTNGTSVFSNAMANSAAPLDVVLAKPVLITNAEFLVTSSYSTENVQVAEMIFNERALPGSFGDWELRQFTAAQINNSALTSPNADPDGDGVKNLPGIRRRRQRSRRPERRHQCRDARRDFSRAMKSVSSTRSQTTWATSASKFPGLRRFVDLDECHTDGDQRGDQQGNDLD